MKSKSPKTGKTGKLQLIRLGTKAVPRKLEPAAKNSLKAVSDLIVSATNRKPTAVLNYLTLSAANTRVSNKGWMNAINCRNVFPDGPNIDFIPQESFGGKIEVWLTNVEEGDSFHLQFRVICGYSGNWKVANSETAHFTTPIIPVAQSIDCFIPPVDGDYGMVLITLEPLFTNPGSSWVFNDVIVNKVDV